MPALAIYLLMSVVPAVIDADGVAVADAGQDGQRITIVQPATAEEMTLAACDARIAAMADADQVHALCAVAPWHAAERDR